MSLGAQKRPQGTFDAIMEFKDAGLVAASAAATVGGVAQIVECGTGLFKADMVVEASAIEVDTGDERYTIIVQGSNSATFANTIVPLGGMELGVDVANLKSADDAPGRYVVPFQNERNGTFYRYLRVYTVVAGTIATGVNFSAYAIPRG